MEALKINRLPYHKFVQGHVARSVCVDVFLEVLDLRRRKPTTKEFKAFRELVQVDAAAVVLVKVLEE
jgi:hypothetical protein